LRALLACLLGLLITPRITSAQSGDPTYDVNGVQYGREFFAPLPFEHIDTVSGNLLLSYTDLSLPGNAGFSLNVVRTYNSNDGRWRFGIAGVPLRFAFTSGSDLSSVDFITADGAIHHAEGSGDPVLTQDFWRFTKSTLRLEFPNGRVATYGNIINGVGGYLVELRDPFDNVMTFNWEAGTDHLQSIVQTVGSHTRTVTFSGWGGDICSGVTYNGLQLIYHWSTIGSSFVMYQANLPTGALWYYTYATDPQGGLKLSGVTTPNGGGIHYTWGVESFPSTPSNRVVVETRTTSGRAPAGTWTFNWLANGAGLTIVAPSARISYASSVQDNRVVSDTRTIATPSGTVVDSETMSYTTVPNPVQPMPVPHVRTLVRDGVTYTTTYSYSNDNYADYGQPNHITETGDLSRTTDITYRHDFSRYIRGRPASRTVTADGVTSTTNYTYDGSTGFLTSQTVLGLTATFTPDSYGNVASVTKPGNNTTTFSYEWGVVKNTTTPAYTVSRTINSLGTVATETRGGTTTTYTYDSAGRVTSANTNTPGRAPATTTFTVNDGVWTATTNARGSVSVASDLDGFGRVVHTTDSTGLESRATYDASGRRIYQSYPFGNGTAETGVTTAYDALGRVVSRDGPNGAHISYDHLGTTLRVNERVTSTLTRATLQYWKAYGNPSSALLTGIKDAAGTVWTYGHDGRGNLTSVDPHTTVPWGWGYDSHGRMNHQSSPEAGVTTYEYDGAGNVTYVTDARGIQVHYVHDGNGRVTSVDAPGTTDDVAMTYDALDEPLTITSAAGTTTFIYDTAGRVTTRHDVLDGHTFDQQFAYDANDRLLTAWYPVSGRRVDYTYDTAGRLTAVTTRIGSGSPRTLESNISYTASGAVASATFGNGLTRSTTVDAMGRPTHLVNGPLDLTYAYDLVGNVQGITDARPAFSSAYSYDLLDRIVGVTGYGATSFSYDATGNRLTSGTVSYTYDTHSRLDHVSGGLTGTFAYDAAGNQTVDASGIVYTYSPFNMVTSATQGSDVTTYAYGGDGLRVRKVGADGVPHYFIHGPGGQLIAEYEGAGMDLALVREYVYDGGGLLASIEPEVVTLPDISVTITSPQQGQTVAYGANVTLTASVSAPAGVTIARVEYYLDGLLAGQSSTAPYTAIWHNVVVPSGTHTLLARAVTADGHAVTSGPVSISN
jgi:YD repeat-containing protein